MMDLKPRPDDGRSERSAAIEPHGGVAPDDIVRAFTNHSMVSECRRGPGNLVYLELNAPFHTFSETRQNDFERACGILGYLQWLPRARPLPKTSLW